MSQAHAPAGFELADVAAAAVVDAATEAADANPRTTTCWLLAPVTRAHSCIRPPVTFTRLSPPKTRSTPAAVTSHALVVGEPAVGNGTAAAAVEPGVQPLAAPPTTTSPVPTVSSWVPASRKSKK